MTTKAKRSKIAPYQLFFIIFVSRIVVTLTYIQTVSVGKLGTDFLFSVGVSYLVVMLASLPIVICVKRGINPFKNTIISMLYSLYFIWISGVNISRFSYFASSRLNTDSTMIFFAVIIALAVCYCAYLGIEGISRFGAFCGLILIFTVLVVAIFNVHNLKMLNYYPIYTNSTLDVIQNGFVMASNSAEPVVLFALSSKVNGNKIKPYFIGVSLAYLVVFILIFYVIGVMGAGASLQSYPVFTLFQLASFGSMSRLDMLHISFWVLALLLKCSVLCYCATISVKRLNHGIKSIIVSALTGVVGILVTELLSMNSSGITKYISLGIFALFTVIIPLLNILLSRGKSVEKN